MKCSLYTICCLTLMLMSTLATAAKPKSKTLEGAHLFISQMEGGLDGFIATEIIKEKLPVTVVTEEKDADYILVGTSLKGDDHWYNTVFGGKDKNEGNVRVLSVKGQEMVRAGEAGDRSLWWESPNVAGSGKLLSES